MKEPSFVATEPTLKERLLATTLYFPFMLFGGLATVIYMRITSEKRDVSYYLRFHLIQTLQIARLDRNVGGTIGIILITGLIFNKQLIDNDFFMVPFVVTIGLLILWVTFLNLKGAYLAFKGKTSFVWPWKDFEKMMTESLI